MNYDNHVDNFVKVKKVGGFCTDLSHFKAGEEKWSKDFRYVVNNVKNRKYFACNHLNGYSYEKNCDMHMVGKLKDFNYLKTLPKFLFGEVIAIETYNTIREQQKFKKHLIKLLA